MPEQTEQLQIVITAKDQATQVLSALSGKVKDVGDGADKMSTSTDRGGLSIGKMVAAVGLGNLAFSAAQKAISFVTDTIHKSVDAAKAEEISIAKVNAVIKTLKISHDAATKSIEASSRAAINLGFDDEDAAESMAKFLQVTGDTTSAQKAFEAAMDLSRLKGIDLASATQQVNLALDGNGRVLSELNVQVPKNATQMEVLGLIHNRVAGQASDFAKTAGGANERYKVSMENLQETVGKLVLPIITKFFSTVSDFLQSEKLSQWITAIKDGFQNYVVPIIQDSLIPAWKNLAEAVKPLMPILGDILKIVGIVIGTAIIGGIKVLAITFNIVAEAVRGVIDAVKTVVEWFQKALDKVSAFKNATGGAISGATNNAGDFFKNLFRAEGGPVEGGRPYIVGERGPELIVPSSSGTVIPNDKVGSAMGGATINFNGITVRSDGDIDTIVSRVLDVLGRKTELARKGIY